MQMRSYEAARTKFSVVEFLSWCVVGLGAIVALIGLAAGSQVDLFGSRSAGLGIVAAWPGIRMSFLGFLGVAAAQVGRAGVDSAEYGQQALQVARDQLEISRQSLKLQRGAPATSFGEAISQPTKDPTTSADAPVSVASYGDLETDNDSEDRPAENAIGSETSARREDFFHRGRSITALSDAYVFDGIDFDTKEEVMAHIDGLDEVFEYRGRRIVAKPDGGFWVEDARFETIEGAKENIDTSERLNQRILGSRGI